MKYAAYYADVIYGVGATSAEALAEARAMFDKEPAPPAFGTALITEALYRDIKKNGWEAFSRSFSVERGKIAETTGE